MKVNKDFLISVVNYIEQSQRTIEKQAQMIKTAELKQKVLLDNISSIVDASVKAGKVPEYLSGALKQDLLKNPSRLVDMLDKSAHSQDFGEPSSRKKAEMDDPMTAFVLS